MSSAFPPPITRSATPGVVDDEIAAKGQSNLALRHGVAAAIAVVVCLCFWPVLSNDFVNWDDPYYFAGNFNYRGLKASNLRWMFTTLYMGHYQPLSWLTHGLVYTVWGMDPTGYHLVNLLLHAANAVLCYRFVALLLALAAPHEAASPWALQASAAVGALVFAIHPLRVEAVAWATERQEVLCAFFFLLSLITYLKAQHARQAGDAWGRWLSVSVGCFALSLLSKAAGIMLPVALLVLDVYPLRRFAVTDGRPAARVAVLFEKVPYAVVALAAALVVLLAKQPDAMLTLGEHGPAARAMQAAYGLCFYVSKTVAPFRLSPLYMLEKPLNPTAPVYLFCAGAVIGTTATLILLRRRSPWALATWVAYAVLVAPLLGFVQSGPQITADRYTYLACLPWAALVAAGVHRLALAWEQHRMSQPAAWLIAAAVVAALTLLGVRTSQQTRIWKNSLTLWNHVLQVEPANYFAYNNRGHARHATGDVDGALGDYNEALHLNPAYANAYDNRGTVRQEKGDLDGALADYTRAVRIDARYTFAYYNRANVRRAKGDLDGAFSDYSQAIRLNPAYANAYNGRGRVRSAKGDLDGALADYDDAIRLDPRYANAYNNRGIARKAKGDLEGAVEDYTRAVQFAPGDGPQRAAFQRNLAAARRMQYENTDTGRSRNE